MNTNDTLWVVSGLWARRRCATWGLLQCYGCANKELFNSSVSLAPSFALKGFSRASRAQMVFPGSHFPHHRLLIWTLQKVHFHSNAEAAAQDRLFLLSTFFLIYFFLLEKDLIYIVYRYFVWRSAV